MCFVKQIVINEFSTIFSHETIELHGNESSEIFRKILNWEGIFIHSNA